MSYINEQRLREDNRDLEKKLYETRDQRDKALVGLEQCEIVLDAALKERDHMANAARLHFQNFVKKCDELDEMKKCATMSWNDRVDSDRSRDEAVEELKACKEKCKLAVHLNKESRCRIEDLVARLNATNSKLKDMERIATENMAEAHRQREQKTKYLDVIYRWKEKVEPLEKEVKKLNVNLEAVKNQLRGCQYARDSFDDRNKELVKGNEQLLQYLKEARAQTKNVQRNKEEYEKRSARLVKKVGELQVRNEYLEKQLKTEEGFRDALMERFKELRGGEE